MKNRGNERLTRQCQLQHDQDLLTILSIHGNITANLTKDSAAVLI